MDVSCLSIRRLCSAASSPQVYEMAVYFGAEVLVYQLSRNASGTMPSEVDRLFRALEVDVFSAV